MTGTEASKLAEKNGKAFGESVGSYVIDGRESKEFCQLVIDGYEISDPEVMDMCPYPLAGENSDWPTPLSVLRDAGVPMILDEESWYLLDVYEESFRDAWWRTVLRAAHIKCGYEPCGVCGEYGHKWKEHAN